MINYNLIILENLKWTLLYNNKRETKYPITIQRKKSKSTIKDCSDGVLVVEIHKKQTNDRGISPNQIEIELWP